MKTTVHRAESRGSADLGWLKANHSFSFGTYNDPERMGFGLLRVINDDLIEPSMGFPTHPHKNMEIVTIPLSGSLQHKDTEGNEAVIRHGEVQLMSAGSGIQHSEFNASDTEKINLLQIWVMPEKLDISPRYEQKVFPESGRKNKFQMVVSPLSTEDEGIKINQQAYFSLVNLDNGNSLEYVLHNAKHGAYIFVIEGEIQISNDILQKRDAMGIEDASKIEIMSKSDSKFLVIEVPMSRH